MSFPLMVSEETLLSLAGTISPNLDNDEGFDKEGTSFIFNGDATNVEMIILNSIMKTLGYKTSHGEDFIWNAGDDMKKWGTLVYTNYPYDKFMKLRDIEVSEFKKTKQYKRCNPNK